MPANREIQSCTQKTNESGEKIFILILPSDKMRYKS